jgi:hypothetical protein
MVVRAHPGLVGEVDRAGNIPVEVPDLSRPHVRRAFTDDDWFPELPELRPDLMGGARDIRTEWSDEDPSGSFTTR